MNISQNGINLIKNFEGCRLESYLCPAQVLTIGYGSTGSHVKRNMKITLKEAEDLLKKDLVRFEKGVSSILKVKVTQNQFDSLVSFAFNNGLGALTRSTLLQKLNLSDYTGASKEFIKWVKVNGVLVEGLLRRRLAEQKLFNS